MRWGLESPKSPEQLKGHRNEDMATGHTLLKPIQRNHVLNTSKVQYREKNICGKLWPWPSIRSVDHPGWFSSPLWLYWLMVFFPCFFFSISNHVCCNPAKKAKMWFNLPPKSLKSWWFRKPYKSMVLFTIQAGEIELVSNYKPLMKEKKHPPNPSRICSFLKRFASPEQCLKPL